MQPTPFEPYWGKPSSNMDWCEPNYVHSPYVAETWNFLSSIPIATFALYGVYFVWFGARTSAALRRSQQHNHHMSQQGALPHFHQQGLYALVYMVIVGVGLGSMAFHGTLTHQGQALDEVPMLWAAMMMTYARLAIFWDHPLHARTAALMFGVCALATVIYFTAGGFMFFFVVYSSTVLWLVIISVQFCRSDPACSATSRRLATMAVTMYGIGSFLCWVPETVMCGNRLHDTHDSIFLSLRMHAVFHLCAGYASYTMVMFILSARLDLERSKANAAAKTDLEAGGVDDTTTVIENVQSVLSFGVPLPTVVEVVIA
eukprot:PhM_4_TR6797/c0_g1_i1/m.84861/K04711/ACER3, YDC1; dihydroceramidase